MAGRPEMKNYQTTEKIQYMHIYLIRHTRPAVEKGICYGQSDIGVTESFQEEAAIIREHLPPDIQTVYSSPLKRCRLLAEHIFPNQAIELNDQLKEINCGKWELCRWDDIPDEDIRPWMDDMINVRIPGGENYTDLFERVVQTFEVISRQSTPAAVIAHGGVIRSILSHITATPLQDSFREFSLYYGCVVKITPTSKGFSHQILSNIPHEKETHKPTKFY